MADINTPREDVPYLPLLAGLAAWPLYRLAVDRIVRWWSPDFHNELRNNYEKKYLFFFGMLLGLMVKPIPLVGCGLAVWRTAPGDDISGFRRPMSPEQQFCWGSRTVIYISELPHYIHVPEMLLHHLLTVLGMIMIAKFHISRRGFDLSLAALWSEIPCSFRNVLKWTGYLQKHPNMDWRFVVYGTIFLFVTRAPATIMSLAMIPASGLQAGPALVIATAYLFHLVYIIRISFMRLKKTGVLQVEESGVFRVQMGDRFNISSKSLLHGTAFMSTQISIIFLYSLTNTGLQPVTAADLVNLTWNSLFAGVVGLAGSRLIAAILQVFVQRDCAALLHWECDHAIAASVLLLSPKIESSINKPTLLFCLIASSTLTSAISQYATHMASLQTKPPVSPEQRARSRASLHCSIINLCQYLIFVSAIATGYSSVAGAAFKTFVLQLVVEASYGSTMAKTSTTISLGAVSALLASRVFNWNVTASPAYHFDLNDNQTVESPSFGKGQSQLPHWLKFILQDTVVIGGLFMLLSTTTSYLCKSPRDKSRISGLPKARTLGLLVVAGWVSFIVYLVSNGETPEIRNKNSTAAEILAREPPFCSLLLSWHFWAAITASAIIPTAFAQLLCPMVASPEKISDEVALEPKANGSLVTPL
ncbi:hypothetical protein Daus18300_003928 [Diaporthe australafricana]|uniref:Uncharacterized protein n=1 Tax=Diaporthe australafricana TaxID=127596 RepID=A0ABR3XCY6_9PEZI